MSISRIGTSTGTNTATPVAHAIGDIIVYFAFRNTTGTPGAGTNYTTPTGGTKVGTTSSGRVSFKIATATSGEGATFANATATVCHVYRSSNYANGASLFIGAVNSSSSTVNTVTYPALTMLHGDNTSWVLGFGGVGNLTETISTAPSGMTNQSLETATATQAAGHDTNGTVSSWSSTNAVTTGTAGNSVSFTVELMENQAQSAITNIIQHVAYGYNAVVSTSAGNNFVYTLPNATLANNGLVLAVSSTGGGTPAITDDKGNTWPASGAAGTVTGGSLEIFRLTTASTGTQKITVGFGSTAVQPVKVWITELTGITGTVNGTASAAAQNSGGIVSPGSMTPTNNNANGGNLILSYMADAATSGGTNPALIIPETGYSLNDADIAWNQGQGNPNASQFFLQATSAATVPRFYLNVGGTETYDVAAIALSLGTQGTAKPAGIHIDRMCYFAVNANATASWLLQIPSTGNLGVMTSFMPATVASPRWTAISDSSGSSWTQVFPVAGAPAGYYNANQTPNTSRTATVTINTTSQILQAVYYDISGAATSPFDTSAGSTSGVPSNTNSVAAQPNITPSGTNELIIAFMQVGVGPTIKITTPSNAIYDSPTYQTAQFTAGITTTSLTVSATAWGTVSSANTPLIAGSGVTVGTTIQSGTGPFVIQPSQNVSTGTTMTQANTDSDTIAFGNGSGHYYNGSDTTAESWTWSISNQPSNTVTSLAMAFKAAPAGSTPVGWYSEAVDIISSAAKVVGYTIAFFFIIQFFL